MKAKLPQGRVETFWNPMLKRRRFQNGAGNTIREAHKYGFKTYNGRVKIYIDGVPCLSFNQLDFKGFYAFKDDVNLYGIDFYLVNGVTIEFYAKTKQVWLDVLKLLDENM